MLGKIVKTDDLLVLKVKPNPEILSEETVISVVAPHIEGYILGRSDAASSYLPDADFSAFDAKQRGISRRHAVLVNYNDMVHVMDLGSMNGTFINGTRLIPYEPNALRFGDRLGLADLNMIIA